MVITHGTWSETGLPKAMTIVLGYLKVQFTKVKYQSSCSGSGDCCILLYVYDGPFIGAQQHIAKNHVVESDHVIHISTGIVPVILRTDVIGITYD